MRRFPGYLCLLVSLALVLGAGTASAQPFNAWLSLQSGVGPAPTTGYVAIPASADFNFGSAFTFEAWVAVTDPGGCSSLFGNGYQTSFWIGVCGTTLRSYFHGAGSLFDGGTVPAGQWTHVAVTFDGTTHRHYIDGELVASTAKPGPIPTSPNELRIGSDVNWEHTPTGGMDEVRIWNVVRTQAQLRSTINQPITGQPGLVALYHFDSSANDAVGGHNGTLRGPAGYLNPPAGGGCTANDTTLCLSGNRFMVTTRFIDPNTGNPGVGHVVSGVSSADSGLFWFFAPTNWEVLVKALNGCSINNYKWVYAAATTTVHYELIVVDTLSGAQRHYFNYQNESAPAVTDGAAFATCP